MSKTEIVVVGNGWVISDIIGGYRVARSYYGYTKREAIRLFRANEYAGV